MGLNGTVSRCLLLPAAALAAYLLKLSVLTFYSLPVALDSFQS